MKSIYKKPITVSQFSGAAIGTTSVALALLFCLVLTGCAFFAQGDPKGALVVVLRSDMLAKTLEPGISLTATTYDIRATGPDGASFEALGVTADTYTKSDIAGGTWTISVTGKNASGTAIVYASKTVTITSGDVSAVSILCVPFVGSGVLELSVHWPTGVIGNGLMEASLTPLAGGAAEPLSFAITGANAIWSNPSIANGYYTLSLKLKDSGNSSRLVWAWVETVLVLKSTTTKGDWVLKGSDMTLVTEGGLTIGVTYDPAAPISICLNGNWPTLTQGRSMTIGATGAPTPEGWQWYLDGDPVSGATSDSVTLGSSLALGTHFVNVTAEKGSRHGSAGFSFVVVPFLDEGRVNTNYCYTYFLTESGDLYVCGKTAKTYTVRALQKIMSDVVKVEQGDDGTTAIIKEDGTLWCLDANFWVDGRDIFVPIGVMNDVIDVSVGFDHILVLKSDHTLWSVGCNGRGQLGDGTRTSRRVPIQIMADVVRFEAGNSRSFVIKSDGSLWGFGSNSQDWSGTILSLLGDGTGIDQLSPVKIMDNVIRVASSIEHVIVVKDDGSVYTWGINNHGQLGCGSYPAISNTPLYVMANGALVAAGDSQSMVLTTDGNLWAFGEDTHGMFGIGSDSEPPEKYFYVSHLPIQIQSGVLAVSMVENHMTMLKDDGKFYGCGSNFNAVLGDTENGVNRASKYTGVPIVIGP